jgi:hypothetical protein
MRFGDIAPLAAFLFAAFMMLLATLPPCPTEDSANCYWDAQTRSNGKGISFIDLGGYLIRVP